jgi:hypothetical protein
MEQWNYNPTYDGVPQGSGISPILSNIYLNELDRFMEDYKGGFDEGTKRKRNPEYSSLNSKATYYRDKLAKNRDNMSDTEIASLTSKIKALSNEMRKISPRIAIDTDYKRIQYVRYADDFIIGVIGGIEDAEQVKSDVKQFLCDKLKLTMSDSKTQITHSGDNARFLGYDITVSRDQSVKRRSDGVLMRTYSYTVQLLVPREKWVSKLQEYKAFKIQKDVDGTERFKALHRGKYINKSDIEILSAYNSEIRGLFIFYSIANNAYSIGKFANIMQYSMYKTFANKYKTKVSKIKAQYIKNGVFTVEYHTKSGMKTSTLYSGGFKRKKEDEIIKDASISILPQYKKYDKVNSFAGRIKAKICELCESKSNDLTFHQVKKLKDLEGVTDWERTMLRVRRKTLAVCPKCYDAIHS